MVFKVRFQNINQDFILKFEQVDSMKWFRKSQKIMKAIQPVIESKIHPFIYESSFITNHAIEEWVEKHNPKLSFEITTPSSQLYHQTLTEFISGVTLTQFLELNPEISIVEKRELAKMIQFKLHFIWDLGIIHGDLHGQNIMIITTQDRQSNLNLNTEIKIIDFNFQWGKVKSKPLSLKRREREWSENELFEESNLKLKRRITINNRHNNTICK